MACFLVPAAEAVVMSIVTKAVKSKEKEAETIQFEAADGVMETGHRILFSQKLRWLTNLLWGGSVLLAFEHLWHGEVTPWFPFLPAMGDSADAMEMFHEMSTAGVAMAVLVTAVWAGMVLVSRCMEKRSAKAPEPAAE